MLPEMQILFSFCGPARPLLLFLHFVIWCSALHGWLTCTDSVSTMPRLSWLVLFHAVRLGFMLALPCCHALRCAFIIYECMQSYFCWGKWNGNPPCASVNNAFGTNVQSFKGIAGHLGWWSTVLSWSSVHTGPCSEVLPFGAGGTSSSGLEGG